MTTHIDADTVWTEIRHCINKVVPALVEVDIRPETPFDSLGISSIEMITIVFEVEELYDIVIVDAGLDVFQSGDEFVKLVQVLLDKKVAA
ncbi:acyl carrier protein [Neorhizobium huautlense]|uniref:Acyl carrier protein n=1 Tax=Neorhizobium huautlense TaxID=67774 RepID=A0ABT9Q1R0_9HYPH|nr:phosphopantetheine-binding protein [Neorhizobium huautlense]MDP9840622.1 acyl carrier protein [Neorhizobium huautlense]